MPVTISMPVLLPRLFLARLTCNHSQQPHVFPSYFPQLRLGDHLVSCLAIPLLLRFECLLARLLLLLGCGAGHGRPGLVQAQPHVWQQRLAQRHDPHGLQGRGAACHPGRDHMAQEQAHLPVVQALQVRHDGRYDGGCQLRVHPHGAAVLPRQGQQHVAALPHTTCKVPAVLDGGTCHTSRLLLLLDQVTVLPHADGPLHGVHLTDELEWPQSVFQTRSSETVDAAQQLCSSREEPGQVGVASVIHSCLRAP
mmetsp:Transcript_23120/g.50738  ORF Transcript_23120/g.50738 Transcript_23120/m.50738 type:complete len:252 (+) Transcript_23120:1158-1913(+)